MIVKLGLRFFVFLNMFEMSLQKNVKSHFLGFSKNVKKNVFSHYDPRLGVKSTHDRWKVYIYLK